MDLFEQISVSSLGGKNHDFILVDDFFRFIWTFFLRYKSDAFEEFEKFYKKTQKNYNL